MATPEVRHQSKFRPLAKKQFRERFLDALSSDAGESDRRVAAFFVGANDRGGGDVGANVAAQLLRGAMVGQRDAAIWTARHVAAFWALH